ncbi:MAG: glycosyltransferase family 4 protein [Paludibacter sp.]|nr:glycosyltransferase family 4 protein [Paludibacter sp.]
MQYIIIFILLLGTELAYFKIANRYNIIDKPNERSSHTKITLRGGGIIFYIATLILFIYSHFSSPYFFTGLTLISAISFLDDLKPQSPKLRLSIHFISIILIFIQWNLFYQNWYIWILALILCIGIINAFNFMDGINGMTGGYSFIVILSLIYVNTKVVSFTDNNFLIIILLAIIVFNIFNFRKKAKCFAGDVGSVSIAFILIYMIGKLIILTGDFSYIILLAIYGVDSILTIIHRIILKENIFEPHRKHLYQIMANELHIPHLVVSTIYGIVQLLISLGFLYFINYKWVYIIISISVLSTVYIILQKKYFHLHFSK